MRILRRPGKKHSSKARKKRDFFDDLSNSGPAVRLYREGRATNLRLDRGNSDLDLRHRIVATADYALPFGRSLNGVRGGVVKGWQVNFIDVWETGSPFTIVNSNPGRSGAHFFGGNTDRPDLVGNPSQSVPGFWFNPAAFAPQPFGAIGNVGKNTLFGPHFRHFDFSVFKNFRVTEGSSLQFRAEFFNLFNQASFGNPGVNNGNNNVTSTTFGQISTVSTNYTPRQIQFVLKYIF